jgi:hypothetical protein
MSEISPLAMSAAIYSGAEALQRIAPDMTLTIDRMLALAASFDTPDEPLVYCPPQGRMVRLNPVAAKQLRFPTADLGPATVADMGPPFT